MYANVVKLSNKIGQASQERLFTSDDTSLECSLLYGYHHEKSIIDVVKSYLNRFTMKKVMIKNLISSNISWHMNIKMRIKLKCKGVTLICKRDNKNHYT